MFHVISHMGAEDMVPVNLGVQLLLFIIVPRESLDGVGDIQTSVDSSFHCGENLGSGGGSGQPNVQATPESARSIILVLYAVVVALNVCGSLVHLVQVDLLQDSTGQ